MKIRKKSNGGGVFRTIARKTHLWNTGRKLRSSSDETRRNAVEDAVTAMVRVLNGPIAGEREAQTDLIISLGEISSATADFIAAYQRETDRRRRDSVTIILAGIGSPAAMSFLLDELRAELRQDSPENVNTLLVESLARLKVREAIPLILEALRAESDTRRLNAFLSHLDAIDPSAADSERDRITALSVCSEICLSSGYSAKAAVRELLAVNERLSDQERSAVVASLARGLKETKFPEQFEQVAEALVSVGGDEANGIVRAALRGEFKTPGIDYNQKMAIAAARALGKSKDRSNLPELQRALESTLYASDRLVKAALLDAITTIDAGAGKQARSRVESRVAAEAARMAAEERKERAEQMAAIAASRMNVEGLDTAELINALREICGRWAAGATGDKTLEARARAIGEVLFSRGGMSEMRRAYAALGGIRGAGTLEMHWGGIGDWLG